MNQGDEGLPFAAADSRAGTRLAPPRPFAPAGTAGVAPWGQALYALILGTLSYAPEIPSLQAWDLPPRTD